MATTVKGGSFGREKRGTSPSTSIINKLPKPSSSTSASSPSSSSPTDGKPVPNYLKPTMSSSLDFSRLPKKSTLDHSSQKPVPNRRRSFDRPPPVSSQGIQSVPGGREIKTLRSTSFISHKPNSSLPSSTRPASERVYGRSSTSLQDTKAEPLLSKSRTLEKSLLSSSTPISKKGTKRVLKSMPSESSFDHDHQSSNQLSVEDDFMGIDSEVQSLPEISEMPDCNQELGDPAILDIEVKFVEDLQDNHETKSGNIDHVEEHGLRVESMTLDHKPDEKDEKIFENRPQPETVVDHQTVEVAGEAEEGNKEASNVEQTETQPKEKKEESILEQEAEKGGEETKDMDENTSVSSPSAGADAAPAPAKAQNVAGKKDKQEYNDVIEETATKLMGGKKNKVLALAGAFETVISLQDTTKN